MKIVIFWFLSVVVVNIVLNLTSDYLKPYLDKYFEKWSDSRRLKNEKERETISRAALEMLNDPQVFISNEGALTRDENLKNMALGLIFLSVMFLIFGDATDMQASYPDVSNNIMFFLVVLVEKWFVPVTCLFLFLAFLFVNKRSVFMNRVFKEYWRLKKENSSKGKI